MWLRYEGKNGDRTERMSFSKVLQLRIQLWLVIRVEFSYFECTVCYLHNNRLDLKLERNEIVGRVLKF